MLGLCRLGLMQGPCVASIAAALLSVSEDAEGGDDGDDDGSALACPSLADQFAMGHENMKSVWQPRARRVQAALLVASSLSAVLAATGKAMTTAHCAGISHHPS